MHRFFTKIDLDINLVLFSSTIKAPKWRLVLKSKTNDLYSKLQKITDRERKTLSKK